MRVVRPTGGNYWEGTGTYQVHHKNLIRMRLAARCYWRHHPQPIFQFCYFPKRYVIDSGLQRYGKRRRKIFHQSKIPTQTIDQSENCRHEASLSLHTRYLLGFHDSTHAQCAMLHDTRHFIHAMREKVSNHLYYYYIRQCNDTAPLVCAATVFVVSVAVFFCCAIPQSPGEGRTPQAISDTERYCLVPTTLETAYLSMKKRTSVFLSSTLLITGHVFLMVYGLG